VKTPRRFGLGFWLKLTVILGLLILVWFNLDVLWETLGKDWEKFKRQVSEGEAFFDVPVFIMSIAVYFSALLVTFYRWYTLVRALDLPFTLWDGIRLGFVGFVSSQIAPGSITGDLVKMGFIAREQQQRAKAVATIIADRLIGLYALFLLSGLIGLVYWQEAWENADLWRILLVIWGITLAGGIFFTLVLAWPPSATTVGQDESQAQVKRPGLRARVASVVGMFVRLIQALRQYRQQPLILGYAILLSMIGHTGFVLSFYLCSLALPLPTPSLSVHYLIIPIGMVAQAVPLVPLGNIGVNESVFAYLYKLVGANPLKGGFVSLAQRGVTWIVALIGLIWYIPLRQAMRKAQAAAEAEEALVEPVSAPSLDAKEPSHETVS
jgi:glycosyltransferase 2 family protein